MPGCSVYSSYVNGLCCKLELYVDGLKSLKVRYVVVYCLDIVYGVMSWKDCVSFGITRLIRASFEITKLICKGTARGRPTRGKKDAWNQSLSFRFCRLTYDVSLYFCVLMAKTILATRQGSLVVVREMPPRRGARRGGRGGRGWGTGRVQPEMREQQQPAPSAPAPAPAPVPVVPQVVPDQLSAEAKHLRDFRKYNPTTFDGSLEDPTRAHLWLSSLETIF
ncbi:gag-protease polyprotein [Cucumis melo var. makuwa]|uniref:Gag-protease polyprotein n=1 Tax=Cucumis melo var. makuwa TaxID=1194695 RepID=A0A5A7TWV7_CUCMM|nr:gag-protease polyprotein [Cucumis melo var. makuwa]TYJ98638.1 gag-protease polyprotein [Cucumis melo var. makuwa]